MYNGSIRLTDEILKKNGWRSSRKGSRDFVLPGCPKIIKNSIGRFELFYYNFKGLEIQCVYDLQLVLQVCGIDKKIVV